MSEVTQKQAFESVDKLVRNPPEPKPCAMCGKPTRWEAFRVPLCCPYGGEYDQIVSECKWDYAEKRRKENWL